MAKISVILPAHNVAPYIGDCLASLHAQTAADFEIIAVDDGSRDATAAIIESWQERFAQSGRGLTLVRREQGGAGAARNDAIDRATGDLLCFVDADDRLEPEALAMLADHIERDPSLELVFPLCRHVDQSGQPTGVVSNTDRTRFSARDLIFANPIHTGTGVTIRRARAEEAGRFDISLPACIDLDYWIRVTGHREGSIAVLPEVLVDYRMRSGQITADWRRMRRGWEAMAARAETIGLGFVGKARDAALARNVLTWATVAYKRGEMSAARTLTREFWRLDPLFALGSSHARLCTLASFASLLPGPVNETFRRIYARWKYAES